LRNILDVLPSDAVLLKLSEIDAADTPDFFDLRTKWESERRIQESGRPFVIFRPTWFMEALPLQLIQNGAVNLFGEQPNPVWFVATEDYARMVCNAIERPDLSLGRIFPVQGPEPLTMERAAQTLVRLARPDLGIVRTPLPALEQVASGGPWRFIYELMKHYNDRREVFQSEATWEILGKPRTTFEDFARSLTV
jgi:uncharacterized protein YbjT (DUF2867 family)